MNEVGLVVGMAAVPPGNMRPDPGKETIGSLGIIREMLDHAANVDEAVAILQSYNVDMEGGPPLHYLMADRSGRAVLVEFYQGEVVLMPNEDPWHQATNFLRASAGELGGGAMPALRPHPRGPVSRRGAAGSAGGHGPAGRGGPSPTPSGRWSTTPTAAASTWLWGASMRTSTLSNLPPSQPGRFLNHSPFLSFQIRCVGSGRLAGGQRQVADEQ